MMIRRTLAALGLLLLALASVGTAQDVKILQQNASTGNGTVLTVTGLSAVGLQIAGVAAGADRVVNWEVSENQTVFGAVMCQNVATLALATTATVDGTTSQVWRCPVSGMTRFRARLSGGTTGACMVRVRGTTVGGGGGAGGAIQLAEVDASPGGAFWQIRVTNGSLTDNGDGTATINIGVPGASGDASSAEASSIDGQLTVFDGAGGKTFEKYNGAAGIVKTDANAVAAPATAADVEALAGDAGADGATKGVVAFAAADFNCASGVCALDYANAQAASGSTKGFLTAADWTTFNTKEPALGFTAVPTTRTVAGQALSADVTLTKSDVGLGNVDNTADAAKLVATAVALAADPTNCDPGFVASGVDAAGVPDCVALPISEGDSITWGAGLAYSSPTASIASTEAGFLTNGGSTDLVGDGGGQGKMQVMATGRLQYTGGEDVSVLYHGYLLPSPLGYNITAATCTGDANGGKLTVNGSNQVVCATDSVGEGGGGPGDMTAVGNLASGDAGTAGFPLTNVWWLESTAPASPASTQGLVWLDSTSKNFAIITSDGAVKHFVQTVAPAANQFVTAIAADGVVSQARPSSADLSDGSALARLVGPQTITATQVVPRVGELSASSGSLTPNADLYDVVYRHDVAGSVAMQDPTATGDNPRNMQTLTVSFYAASAQAVTWTSGYAGGYGLALPDTIPAGKYTAVAFRYNSTSAKWELWSAHDPTIYVNSVLFQGTTDGVITMQPQASAGAYNFNLPTTAGAAGQPLLSGGGGASAMTFGTLGVAGGGSDAVSLTGVLIGNGTSAFTAAMSATVGQVLRVTGANTYALGALDLADPDAVTGILPAGNLPPASDTASGVVELATTAETSTGTDAARAVTPDGLAGSVFGERYITMECVGDTVALTTGDGKCYFPFPSNVSGWLVVGVHAHLGAVVSSSGAVTVDMDMCGAVATGIRCSGTNRDLLSTNLTVDQDEDGSETAAVAAVIDTASDDIATGEWFRVNVDGAGTSAQGLYVTIVMRKP